MKRVLKKSLVLLLMLIAVFSTVSVYAASADPDISAFVSANAELRKNGAVARAGTTEWQSLSVYFSEGSPDGTKTTKIAVKYGGDSYMFFYDAAETDNIKAAIGNASISDSSAGQVTDITSGLNIKADTASATQMLSGFIPIVNVLTGLLVVIIILLLAVYTGFDILYLAFPVFRGHVDDQKQNGQTGMNVKKGSDGECKFRFISDDAVRAYQASTMDGGNKQPYVKYAVSRVWAYIALALILTILLTGNYDVFLRIGIKIGEGIINFVGSL